MTKFIIKEKETGEYLCRWMRGICCDEIEEGLIYTSSRIEDIKDDFFFRDRRKANKYAKYLKSSYYNNPVELEIVMIKD